MKNYPSAGQLPRSPLCRRRRSFNDILYAEPAHWKGYVSPPPPDNAYLVGTVSIAWSLI